MNSIIDLLERFEGIIGTLLGVVITFILTALFKKMGKVYYDLYDWYSAFYGQDDFGEFVEVYDLNRASYYTFNFSLRIYNSSELSKAIKNLKAEFYLKDGKIIETPIHDYLGKEKLNSINIFPKQIIEYELYGTVLNEQMKTMNEVKEVCFVAEDYKNRRIKELIHKF